MIFFIIFVIIPLIEIGLFISVGEEIGLIKTLFLCLLTAMVGAALIRWQGIKALFSAKNAMSKGQMPVSEMFDGICLAVAGALLMTPGFFTDAIGFSLLVPSFRAFMRTKLAGHFDLRAHTHGGPHHQNGEPDIIDVEYETIENNDKSKDKS